NAAASGNLDIGVLSGLLEALQNSLRHAAAVSETFSKHAGFLTGVLFRLQLNALCAHDGADLSEGQHIIGVSFNSMFVSFRLLGDTGADEYGNRLGVLRLQQPGYRTHGRYRRRNVSSHLREMLPDVVYKRRAAGSGHLLSFLKAFRPFLGFKSCGQVSAESNLNEIGKTYLLHGRSPARHCDVGTELSLSRRSQHGDYPFP